MEFWTLIIALIVVTIVIILFLWFRTMRRAEKHVIVSALIDIYPSGSHHIEFIPPIEDIHPVDIVQLAISYIANVIFVTVPYNVELKQSLEELIQFTVKHESLSDEVKFRQDLKELVKIRSDSLLSSGKFATGESERYQVRLVRGNQIDYSLSKFSIYGYKPNLPNSTVYLYSAIAHKLDVSHLKLLHNSLITLIRYFEHEKPTLSNHQAIAFAAVEYILKVSPEPIENSPGRVYRKNSELQRFNLIESHKDQLASSISHRVQLENLLGEFEQHIRQVRSYLAETDNGQPVNLFGGDRLKLMEKKYLIDLQCYNQAEAEANAAHRAIEEAQSIWPQGKRILKELLSGVENLQESVRTLKEAHQLFHPDVDFDEKSTLRLRQFLLQNRQYIARAEKHFNKGCKSLSQATGLNILEEFTLFRS
jgi:hypothetical protein